MTGSAEFRSRMAELKRRFLAQAPDRLAQIRDAWGRGDIDEVHRINHKLCGVAGTFGFPEVSDIAADLEEAIETKGADDRVRTLFTALVARLEAILPEQVGAPR